MLSCNHTHCQQNAMATAIDVCAAQGVKLTETRAQVLKILWQSHQALTAAEIMHKLKNTKPPITYRALAFLKVQGLVHHITTLNAYIGCPTPHRQHLSQMLVCTNCHIVQEVAALTLQKNIIKQAQTHHFKLTEAHIELLGLCQACQA